MSKAKKLLATAALIVLGPLCIVTGYKELSNTRKLQAHGQKAEAQVVDGYKYRRKLTTSYHLTISFQTATGQSVRRSVSVRGDDYEKGQADRRATVYYLPEEPEICAVGETVETKFGTLLAGIAMFCGGIFLAVTFKRPADHHEAAQVVAKEFGKLCVNQHEYGPANLKEFKNLDLGWYDTSRQRLEGLGFGFLQDVENLTASRNNPGMKAFLRVHLGRSGTAIGALFHIKPGFLLRVIGAKESRVVSLDTEFSNGHWVSTGNAEASGALASPPEVDNLQLPAATPIEAVAQAHETRVAKFMAKYPEAQPVQFHNIDEVLQAENRQQAIKAAFRQSHGLSKGELERIVGTTSQDVARIHAESQLLREEQKSRAA